MVDTLTTAARTGKIGDGKIFVASIDDAIRIRNGDHGEAALKTKTGTPPGVPALNLDLHPQQRRTKSLPLRIGPQRNRAAAIQRLVQARN